MTTHPTQVDGQQGPAASRSTDGHMNSFIAGPFARTHPGRVRIDIIMRTPAANRPAVPRRCDKDGRHT
jgi:hypothetical protein